MLYKVSSSKTVDPSKIQAFGHKFVSETWLHIKHSLNLSWSAVQTDFVSSFHHHLLHAVRVNIGIIMRKRIRQIHIDLFIGARVCERLQ